MSKLLPGVQPVESTYLAPLIYMVRSHDEEIRRQAVCALANLSEDATENDVQELCRNFGSVRRVYIATDKRTGLPRGFAFVDFHNKTDALKAIETLNGYGYDNLILSVSMAEPSKPREGDAASRPLIRSVAAS